MKVVGEGFAVEESHDAEVLTHVLRSALTAEIDPLDIIARGRCRAMLFRLVPVEGEPVLPQHLNSDDTSALREASRVAKQHIEHATRIIGDIAAGEGTSFEIARHNMLWRGADEFMLLAAATLDGRPEAAEELAAVFAEAQMPPAPVQVA